MRKDPSGRRRFGPVGPARCRVGLPALAVAIVVASCGVESGSRDLPALVAGGDGRPFPGRLSFERRHRPWIAPQGSPVDPGVLGPVLRSAREAGDSGAALALRGRAELLAGRLDLAVGDLERAAAALPDDAGVRSDLAVALWARADEQDRPLDLLAALLEAEQAADGHPAARFNRAALLERLHLHRTAARAWQQLAEEPTADGWRAEAVDRLRGTGEVAALDRWEGLRAELLGGDPAEESLGEAVRDFPSRSRSLVLEDLLGRWAEAEGPGEEEERVALLKRSERIARVLAKQTVDLLALEAVTLATTLGPGALAPAHRLYTRGMKLYERREHPAASPLLAQASRQLGSVGSPVALEAGLYAAICDYFDGSAADSRVRFAALVRSADAERYPSVVGRSLWMLGTVDLVAGRIEAAIPSFARMEPLLRRADGPHRWAMTSTLLATSYDLRGEVERGWRYRLEALGEMVRWGEPGRRHGVLLEAADALVRREEWELASIFLEEVAANLPEWGEAAGQAELLTVRSRVRRELGDPDGALRDADGAVLAALRMREDNGRERTWASALLSRGMARLALDPGAALVDLHRAHVTQTRSDWEVERLLYLREAADARRRLGERGEEEKLLRRSVESWEAMRAEAIETRSRIVAFREAQPTFDRLIELALTNGDEAAAFAWSERARARWPPGPLAWGQRRIRGHGGARRGRRRGAGG